MKSALIVGLFLVGAQAWAITIEDRKAAEELVYQAILKSQPVENTGVGVSIFSSKKIILQKGYGYRDQNKKIEVDAHTVFAIGSTTKAFTSLGVKLLETIDTPDHLKNYPPPGSTPYLYPHNYPHHWVKQDYTNGKIPEFYRPSGEGKEIGIKQRLDSLKKL